MFYADTWVTTLQQQLWHSRIHMSGTAMFAGVDYDDMQNTLLSPPQASDVWLCDANEAGGTAEWRLFLHRLPVFRSHRLCHRSGYVCFSV